MALLVVNGVPLPGPVEFKVKCSDGDSDNSKRGEDWVMHRDRVRANIYRIDVTWQVAGSDYTIIMNALNIPVNTSASVTFWDPNTGAFHTANMYPGDRDAELIALFDEDMPANNLWRLSCPLVQL